MWFWKDPLYITPFSLWRPYEVSRSSCKAGKYLELTHCTSCVSSTLGNMMAGGRTSACRMTCRSASAKPLDTEFTLTHFSVRPRSSSANILGMVSLASACSTAEWNTCRNHDSFMKELRFRREHLKSKHSYRERWLTENKLNTRIHKKSSTQHSPKKRQHKLSRNAVKIQFPPRKCRYVFDIDH